MASSAQQKPKATRGTRNPNRRNGKAFGRDRYNEPTFKTVMGYKREKVVEWAAKNGRTFTQQVDFMKDERRRKRQSAASQRIEVRRGNPTARCRQRCCNPA